tara:strand:+ start:753 stop:1085 length:333 start_codon:yes stop_codon:yes gene_type:complete
MKDDGFMKMIHTELPPEAELAIELRCREVMSCKDIDKLKAFCVDMMKNHARAEAVLSKAMMKVIELEATVAVMKAPIRKSTGIHKVRWWIEQIHLHWKYRKITKRHSHRA